jgi:hypothetical protein
LADVFIAHSPLDHERVKSIVDRLTSLGYSVWLDKHAHGRQAPIDEVTQELEQARCVLVLWSHTARTSLTLFAQAALAHDSGKLLQVRLDTAPAPSPFDTRPVADMSSERAGGWGLLEDALTRMVRDNIQPEPLRTMPRFGPLATASPSGAPKLTSFALAATLLAYTGAVSAASLGVMAPGQLQVALTGMLGVGALSARCARTASSLCPAPETDFMARSLLQDFISGTRQMLSVQLFLSIVVIALAGWTLSITNQVIRERDALLDRVVQLEQIMAARGEIPPEPPAAVIAPAGQPGPYPGTISEAREIAGAATTTPTSDQDGIGDMLSAMFSPAPPISTVVLHVRSEADRADAEGLAQALHDAQHVRAAVRVMPQSDASAPTYVYFDGRQNRAAAELVNRFHDLSRERQIAVWAAQIQGVALPARGEYTADRLDIVLPALPAAPSAPSLAASAPTRQVPR